MSAKRAVPIVLVAVVLSVLLPGPRALASTEGTSNNFFGTGAGINNGTGFANSFFGGEAGFNNTSGQSNSFVGRSAGFVNTTGSENSFVGASAGQNNGTGFSNSFYGYFAGFQNQTGDFNSFFGARAGENNTSGNNAFFGHSAGQDNTTGEENSFLGRSAGIHNTVGGNNSFVGRSSGQANTTGSNNVFVGHSAGISNNVGGSNTFIGRSAGQSNTTEDFNTSIGSFATGASGITNATSIGHRSLVAQSNSLVLGSIAGVNDATADTRVGVGTATPAAPFHVHRTDGTSKVVVEEASATAAGRNLMQLTNNGAARFRITNIANAASWDFQTSGGGGSFVIDLVGGPSSLDFEIQPDGDAVHRGSVTATSFITSSDRNLKADVSPANVTKLMEILRELDISTWRFKSEPDGTVHLGPMAQDFHRLFGMGTETTIDVRDLAALALVVAQLLDSENSELDGRVERLEKLIER